MLSQLEQKLHTKIQDLENEKQREITARRFLCSDPIRRHSYGKGGWMAQGTYFF
jgi:hypothetical protein